MPTKATYTQRQEKADREAWKEGEGHETRERKKQGRRIEWNERVAREQAEQEAKEQAGKVANEIAEQEAKGRADEAGRAKAEEDATRKTAEAKEHARRGAREKKERSKREGKEEAEATKEEESKFPTPKIPSAWGSTVTKDDRSGGTSSGLPPIATSSVTGGIFDGAGSFDFFATGENNPPGNAEVELQTVSTKRDKDINNFNLSEVPTPAEPGKLDILEGPGVNTSAKVSVSSENERSADAEQRPSASEPTPPCPSPEAAPEEPLSTHSEFLSTPKDVTEEVSATPKPSPVSSRLTPTRRTQVPIPISTLANDGTIVTPAPIGDSDSARRDDSAQSQMAVKPVTEPVPR